MTTASLVWRQYRLERRMFWRNPSAAFFNFLLPLLFLVLLGTVFHSNKHELRIIVPGIAGMSVMSTTFTALAYNVTFLRERGILKRIRGTPLPGPAYLAGLALNALTNTVVQIAIVVVAGKVFFGLTWPLDWGELVVFTAAGVLCFASLGVALSHAIPNFESATAYINGIFLPVLFISGAFYDIKSDPGFLREIASALPLKTTIDGLTGALVNGRGIGHYASSLAVIGVWTALGLVLAGRGFSWEGKRR